MRISSQRITVPVYKKYLIIVSVSILLAGIFPQLSHAQSTSELQRQIDVLSGEIRSSRAEVDRLRSRADTYENRLAILNAEGRQIQAEINATNSDIRQTRSDIKKKEAELERTKELIQENVKVLYKQGNPSTLEILFSSSNFSEFISRQEYLDAVKKDLNAAAEESVKLKKELEKKAAELKVKSKRLNGQKQQLAEKQSEQRKLISQTRGEESRYRNIVRSQQAQRQQLEEQQRAAYAAAAAAAQSSGQFVGSSSGSDGGSSSGGSYPWASGPYPCWSSNCVDPWGLFYRECVSYTAWKVASTGRFVPHFGGAGHARQWPSTAALHGIPSGSTPRVGSVAVSNLGIWGHTMYVEAVLGGGMIRISEYNFLPGQYTERVIPASGLTYVYF